MRKPELPLNKGEWTEVLQMFLNGRSTVDIQQRVQSMSRKSFHIRTIYGWQKNFRKQENLYAKDQPVNWEKIENIPIKHLPILRQVEAWGLGNFGTSEMFFYGSTPRSIKWQNYVLSHTDHDYLDLGRDVWVLGECFSQREFYSDYQVEPIFKSDLESLLTFAPWMSNEREESYLKAIAGGTALERDLTWTLGKTKMDLSRYGYAQSLSLLSTEKAYLLPSMQKSLTFNESPENSKQLTEPENDPISTNITNKSPIYHNQLNSWRSLDRF